MCTDFFWWDSFKKELDKGYLILLHLYLNSYQQVLVQYHYLRKYNFCLFLSFCHTNYFIRSNINVEFYKDKAKITSPGGLYKTTLEDVLKGVQTYRNERLVHLLDKLGLIENYGTGIARTLNAYKGTGREPEFYDSENFFIVYLPNLNYRDQINDQINDQITELGLSILRTVSGNPGIKADRIHEILSSEDKAITLNMVRNSIKRELRNYIELRGSRKTGGYYLKEIPHKPGE